MPRSKAGHVRKLADGKYWIKVQHGFKADVSPRVMTETFRGTEREAEIRCKEIAARMGRSEVYGDGMELSDYYWHVFRDSNSNRGKPRSKATLRMYDDEMRLHIEPSLGHRDMNDLSHAEIRQCVERSSSPDRTKRVLRAVLKRAYDDELLDEEPFRRRVPTHTVRKEQVQPWSVPEAQLALERFKGADPRLEAYLIYGLSSMRKEEALG